MPDEVAGPGANNRPAACGGTPPRGGGEGGHVRHPDPRAGAERAAVRPDAVLAAGLTLVFGIMDMINLAHGSLYMLGAFLAAMLVSLTGSFALGVILAVPATAALGMLLEMSLL